MATDAVGMRYFEDMHAGDVLPPLVKPPITLPQLVRYAGASGDFNPLHYDPAVGESMGTGGIIAHGMFVMGCAGQLLSDNFGAANLRKFGVRFKGMTRLGDVLTCSATITNTYEEAGESRVAGEISVTGAIGDVRLLGTFVAAVPRRTT